MIKKAVRMKLYPGLKEEYAKRHNELWPEMRAMLKEHGAQSYSIFYDPETDYLFGYLEIGNEKNGHKQQIPRSIVNGGISWWI